VQAVVGGRLVEKGAGDGDGSVAPVAFVGAAGVRLDGADLGASGAGDFHDALEENILSIVREDTLQGFAGVLGGGLAKDSLGAELGCELRAVFDKVGAAHIRPRTVLSGGVVDAGIKGAEVASGEGRAGALFPATLDGSVGGHLEPPFLDCLPSEVW